MSKIVIFSKDDCPYCVRAKTLLNTKNIQFEEIVIGRDIDKDKFVATYPFAHWRLRAPNRMGKSK